jgi:hypothetical protein
MTDLPTQVPPDATPGPSTPPASAPSATSKRSRVRTLFSVLLVLATVAAVAYYAYLKLGREARSPSELADRFGQAGVTCTDRKATLDLKNTKSLWCATADGKAITVTTWAEKFNYDQWLNTHCRVTSGAAVERGAAVVADKWIVDIQRLVRTGPTAEKVATALSGVLGGSVRIYDCGQIR